MLNRNRFVEDRLPIFSEGKPEDRRAGTDVSACANFGLHSAANQREFAGKFAALHKQWASLTPAKRVEQLQTLANEQLAKTGVPPMSLRSLPLNNGADACSGHSYGYFAADGWNMVLASEDVNVKHLQNADAGEMADTLYHESRHAEQNYLVARLEAAKLQKSGMTADQQIDAIAKKAEVKRSVAAQAQKNPLPDDAPEHACAEALDKETVQDKDKTGQTEGALSTAGTALCEAIQKREKAEAALLHAQRLRSSQPRLHSLQTAVQSAKEAEAKAQNASSQAFKSYEDLFIETDARDTATSVHQTIDPGWQP